MDSKDKDIKETKEMVKLRHKLVYDIETRFNQYSMNPDTTVFRLNWLKRVSIS